MKRMLFAALMALSAFSPSARAETWVRLAPWIYLDTDSIRRDGEFTYYIIMHSAEADRDPRASGAMASRTPTPARVNCSNADVWVNFGSGWELDEEPLYSDSPEARYLCPEWFR